MHRRLLNDMHFAWLEALIMLANYQINTSLIKLNIYTVLNY